MVRTTPVSSWRKVPHVGRRDCRSFMRINDAARDRAGLVAWPKRGTKQQSQRGRVYVRIELRKIHHLVPRKKLRFRSNHINPFKDTAW